MGGVELNIELDEPLYLALRLRAARDHADPSAVVNSILRRALAGDVAVAAAAPPLASVLRYVVGAERVK